MLTQLCVAKESNILRIIKKIGDEIELPFMVVYVIDATSHTMVRLSFMVFHVVADNKCVTNSTESLCTTQKFFYTVYCQLNVFVLP